jgi:YD repeat-containing protein
LQGGVILIRSHTRRYRAILVAGVGLLAWVGLLPVWHDGEIHWRAREALADSLSYAFDGAGRLIQATNGTTGQAICYAYDAAGNITSQQVVPLSTLAISGFSTNNAGPGTQITIDGTGFSTTATANTVTINGVPATVVSATATQLVVIIPSGAGSGPITITTGGASVTGTTAFTVTAGIRPDGNGILAGKRFGWDRSHDFRNPLHELRGAGEGMGQRHGSDHSLHDPNGLDGADSS